MKNPMIVLAFILVLVSGCTKPYMSAGVDLQYPNISSPVYAYAILTDRDDINQIIDTNSLGELHALNGFTVMIEFDEDPPNYIVFIPETKYRDTISDIYFERNTRTQEVTNFEYKFNGKLQSNVSIVIE